MVRFPDPRSPINKTGTELWANSFMTASTPFMMGLTASRNGRSAPGGWAEAGKLGVYLLKVLFLAERSGGLVRPLKSTAAARVTGFVWMTRFCERRKPVFKD